MFESMSVRIQPNSIKKTGRNDGERTTERNRWLTVNRLPHERVSSPRRGDNSDDRWHTWLMSRPGRVSRRTFIGAAAATALVACSGSTTDGSAPEVLGASEPPIDPTTTTSTAPSTTTATTTPPVAEVTNTTTTTTEPAEPTTTADGIPLRRLARIDWLATAITIGGAALRDSRVVSYAVERGVNVIDTAPSYGNNHETVKPVLADHRDKVLLLSKVRERRGSDIDGALRSSLERMGVDSIDIVLLHDITDVNDLDRATASDGAVGALEAARAAGVVRYIGLSGHVRADVLTAAFDRFDVDLVLCPINPMDSVIDDFVSTAGAAASQRGAAVMGMKVMASGRVPDTNRALRWALSQPAHTLTLGMMSNEEIDLNLETAIEWQKNPPTREELAGLVEEWRPMANKDNFYWRR